MLAPNLVKRQSRFEGWIHTLLREIKKTPVWVSFLFLVEARGIEPLSENHLIQLSPSAADLLRFPSRIADRQAMRYGSHYGVTSGVAPCRSRSPLIDASLPTAVLRGKTGGLIRLPTQRYCCRLLFKSAGFIAGPPPLLAYRISQSPSKPLRPHVGIVRNALTSFWRSAFPPYLR